MAEIIGYVERITYQNAENGYTVAKLQEKGKRDVTCVVGSMPDVHPGVTIRCLGQWKRHLVHGMQFQVEKYHIESPADITGIQKYLGSGLIKGIGPAYATRIVEKFGKETLDIIDKTPKRLLEVGGLGKKRVGQITSCWQEQRAIRDVMIFLQSHQISPTYAQKIFKRYGNSSIEKMKENPYILAKDIFGIGFKTADTIASKLGVEKDSPQRIDSGILYVLSELSSDGHTCFPLEHFLVEAESILEVPLSAIQERLAFLEKEERIVLQKLCSQGSVTDFIWNTPLYRAENGIAREVHRILKSRCFLRQVDVEKALDWVQQKLNMKLGGNQAVAVKQALQKKLQIITGGPGTGKSTITNAILKITEKLTGKIVLAAPTGRAAKRMSEITGRKASTIHSLLEVNFKGGGFKRNRENPLDLDLMIVDEASMIDTLLMNSLLKAIPSHARLIFVGDINQLPSVGPGNVLKDLIDSRSIPVVILKEIFRQAAGSAIVTNAHRINKGIFPELDNKEDGDFFFLNATEPEEALRTITSLVTQRLPKKYHLDPIQQIQVLAPMKRGIIGCENLNITLQETLNPSKNPILRYGRKYAVGDKVMQIRNNYKKEVFNGDVGKITKIDQVDHKLYVTIDDKIVEYEFSDLDELVLAYAVSVHKYQGSECPCIVMPIHTTHFKMLHRNLLYTGVTRGKKLVILVGTKKALAIAVKNDEVKARYTGLLPAMQERHLTSKKCPV